MHNPPPPAQSRVSVCRCNDYTTENVLCALKKTLAPLGGMKAFIKPGSSVLVKPNLLMAKDPQAAVTTHPEVVRAVIRLLKEIRCSIFVGDSPSAWDKESRNVDEVYSRTGMQKVCAEESVNLVRFEKKHWHGNFPLTDWLDKCDFLVNVPKFKTHQLTVLSGAVKNLFGLVPGEYKIELHKRHSSIPVFCALLADILQKSSPALTIVDGITALEGDGPSTKGIRRSLNLLLASSDPVALDSIMAAVMGIKPYDVPTTMEAAGRGLGNAEISSITVHGIGLPELVCPSFKLPKAALTSRLPDPLRKFIVNRFKVYPLIEQRRCLSCGRCIKICPNKAVFLKNGRVCIAFAKCIACFCCQECCPQGAISVKKNFLVRILGI